MGDSTNSTGRVTYRHRDLEVACNLGAGDVGTRMGEWRRLREEAGLGMERIEGGVRLWLDARSHATAADLARRESECCRFLDFDLVPEGGRDRFDITSAAREAVPVIDALVGEATQGDTGSERC